MLIDKTKFLALVAAISTASAACIIVDDDDGIGGDNVGAGNEGAGNQGAGNQGGDGAGGDNTGGNGGAGGGVACLDDTGTPPACDSTCEGFTNCNGVANLKEGVEEEMVTCMNALDPITCSFDTDVLNGCYFEAAGKACVDPESDAACATAATSCGTEANMDWLGACAAYMDGMNASGQALFEACLEMQCTNGLTPDEAIDACVYDVLFPTG